MKWRNVCTLGVLLVGFTQMAGDLMGNRALKGVGAATAMAPCPKVFCDMNGLEPFASTFEIIVDGPERRVIPIGPELYSHLTGPYNRRNVYGAAIAAAPRLPDRIWRSVFSYAFSPGGPLHEALGLPKDAKTIHVSVQTKTRNRNEKWVFPCTK